MTSPSLSLFKKLYICAYVPGLGEVCIISKLSPVLLPVYWYEHSELVNLEKTDDFFQPLYQYALTLFPKVTK